MQRVDIITGHERRRRWSDEDKRRLTAEAFAPGAVVSHVARQHGIAESCLYAWRKRLGAGVADTGLDPTRLIPVMVGDTTTAASPLRSIEPLTSPQAVVTLPDGTRLAIEAGYPVVALKALLAAVRRR